MQSYNIIIVMSGSSSSSSSSSSSGGSSNSNVERQNKVALMLNHSFSYVKSENKFMYIT